MGGNCWKKSQGGQTTNVPKKNQLKNFEVLDSRDCKEGGVGDAEGLSGKKAEKNWNPERLREERKSQVLQRRGTCHS